MFYKQNTDCIEFSPFLEELAKNIKNTYEIEDMDITVHVDGTDFELCLDYIIPCGLIANEIIVNAYKYAFGDSNTGNINIQLYRKNGIKRMTISDDGIGMHPETVELSKTLGISLVRGLTEQIHGTLNIESSKGKGTTYTIEFADVKTKNRKFYG